MARFRHFASNPIHPRLMATCMAAFLCFGSAQAARPVVQESMDAIDTTFGEVPEPPAAAPEANAASDQTNSDSTPFAQTVAEEAEPASMEDGAFEDVFAPGEPYERNWSLDFQTSLGGTDRDSTTRTVWIGLSRRFGNETESFVPRAGWIRTSQAPEDPVSHIGIFGASVSRSFPMDIVAGSDVEWKTQEGPDAWSASANLAWTREVSELFEVSASWGSGWSNVSRTLHGASVEATAYPGSWIASVGASWNRRWQEYHYPSVQWRTEYVHAWGWSASLLWTSGSWTTGPTWTGEYWSTDSWVDTSAFLIYWYDGRTKRFQGHSRPRSRSVSSQGVAVDQTLSWIANWKPIESLRVKLDVSRSFGLSAVPTRSTNARKIVPTSTVDAYLPADSWGGTFGFSFDW